MAYHNDAEYGSFKSYYRAGGGNVKPPGWIRFTDLKAYISADGNPTAGNGNYRPLSDSPAFFIPTVPLYDYDIEIAPRGLLDPPGAYAAGNTKKGLM